jgi:hypothetical protein
MVAQDFIYWFALGRSDLFNIGTQSKQAGSTSYQDFLKLDNMALK